MSSDLEHLRKRVGIDRLEKDQRKELLQRFVDHGGSLTEAQQHSTGIIMRKKNGGRKAGAEPEKQAASGASPDRDNDTLKPVKGGRHRETAREISKGERDTARKRKNRSSLPSLIKLYLKGIRLRVHTPGGHLSKKWIDFFKGEAKLAIMDLHATAGSFLGGSSSIELDIRNGSTGAHATFYEFILRIRDLYQEEEYEALERLFKKTRLPGGPYLHVLVQVVKRLYMLAPFQDRALLYLYRALDLQTDAGKLDPVLKEQTLKRTRRNSRLLFQELLPRLHFVLCKTLKIYCPVYSNQTDKLLEITPEDRIGFITDMEARKRTRRLKKLKSESRSGSKPREAETTVPPKPARHVERGMHLVEKAINTFNETHRFHDSPLQVLSVDDKMYQTAILLEFFDREYSFILTSSRVCFNIDYREQRKVDVREELGQQYSELNEVLHGVQEYLDLIGELKETESNLRLTSYQRHQLLQGLGRKQASVNRKTRARTAELLNSIQSTLSSVIMDYNEHNLLLANPDEVLSFDESYDRETCLSGKRVIEAVVEVFLFTSAFHFLLWQGGLSGAKPLIGQDKS